MECVFESPRTNCGGVISPQEHWNFRQENPQCTPVCAEHAHLMHKLWHMEELRVIAGAVARGALRGIKLPVYFPEAEKAMNLTIK